MKVLVACEESQRVCIAFRKRGHEAYSCDIIEPSGGHPEWHILGDVIPVLDGGVIITMDGKAHDIARWDLVIAHPPCTYLSHVATRKHSLKATADEEIRARTERRIEAMRFFMAMCNAPCDRIAVENPVGVMNTCYRAPNQIIEPYMWAETPEERVTKRTCLWLKGLPKLEPTYTQRPDNSVFGKRPNGRNYTWEEMQTGDRSKARSKTFLGIAEAMAEQWGEEEI